MYPLPPLPAKKKPRPAYRKPQVVKDLECELWETYCREHSSIDPKYLARTSLRDDRSGGLTQCIVTYAKLRGCFASRLNTTGVYDAKLKKYRYTPQRRGLPDVLITGHPKHPGVSIFCEVKIKNDRASEHQLKVQAEQEQAGGYWFEAHDFTSFKQWFDFLQIYKKEGAKADPPHQGSEGPTVSSSLSIT